VYFLIGASLLFTFLLAVGIAAAAVFTVSWKILEPLCAGLRPSTRGRIAFLLRVLPIIFSLLVIFAFILPAFVLFEPENSGEKIGIKLAVVIGTAMFGIAAALFRTFGSWWRTRRLINDWMKTAEAIQLDAAPIRAYRLPHPFPVFAVVGVLQPRLFIAQQVLETLDENELAAVIEHEIGHISALDNLKRLAMKLCGDILVFPIGRAFDRYWSEAAESAADEFAVRRGGRAIALNLAEALIKIARIIPSEPLPPMPAASYIAEGNGESLASRIRRLLQLAEEENFPATSSSKAFVPMFLLSALIVVILATDHSFLARIHNFSELVLSTLQ
jgi:Zn-dependent protease with chaperone function